MIQEGKADGWLQLPPEALLQWADFNGIAFGSVVPGIAEGKGGALVAREELSSLTAGDAQRPLMTVPRDLSLSLERVLEHAKIDQDFREVLGCLGEFGRVGYVHVISFIQLYIGTSAHRLMFAQTARGTIVTFIIVQASISCPLLSQRVGVHSPFTE